jgi:hypothetical protein
MKRNCISFQRKDAKYAKKIFFWLKRKNQTIPIKMVRSDCRFHTRLGMLGCGEGQEVEAIAVR